MSALLKKLRKLNEPDQWLRLHAAAKQHPIFSVAVAVFVMLAAYWLFIASDRYVSQAHIVVQRTDLSGGQEVDFSSLLSGSAGVNRSDQLMLRDYLLSVGMLKKLDAELKLRAHYSGWLLDPISKFWFEQAPVEWLHRYYLSRVSIELDDYSGLLFVNVQGFSPEMSQAIAIMLLREGDAFMNQMGHQLAQTQVDFLENQVSQMQKRAIEARQALLSFQNKKGLASPQAAAENVVTIVAKLQANLSELQTQRSAVQAYLVASHPTVVQLNQQIAAVEKQITQEQAKLAAPSGKPLNQTVEEYQRLEMQAAFTDAVYKTAISALERGRIEATRTIKKISVLQAPTLPEYPLEPRRLYNTLLSFLVAFLLAGVTQLLVAIVHDHKD